jgi:hypothetical protein
MIKIAGKYGLLSGIMMAALFLLSWYAFHLDFSASEIFGYTSIVVSLFIIYFGVKNIRDKQLGGVISFQTALLYGCLISVVAGVILGAIDALYVAVLNPGFEQQYAAYLAEQAKNSGKSPAEIEADIKATNALMQSFTPFTYFLLMFATVAIIGIVESIIFSFMLRRSDPRQG